MKFLQYFFPVLLPAVFSASCMHASTQVKASPVFTPTSVAAEVPAELQGRGVRRVRAVEIDLELFRGGPRPAEMNFFPDAALTVEWKNVEKVEVPPGVVWSGTVVGSPLGQAAMVISGRNITANITRGDGFMYQIRTSADGRWWVREIDQKEFPRDLEPVIPNLK
jgi:hypothetical protein